MRSLLLMMMLAPFAWAELKIEGNEKVAVYKTVRLKATGAAPDAAYIWDVDKEGDIDADESGAKFSFSAPPGVYRIKLRSVSLKDGKTTIETARFVVTVGPDLPPPKPLPDDPPAPKPPAPVDGPLRVLIVYESAERANMPPAQDAILGSVGFRAWLNGVCGDDPQTGSKKAWWMLDKDADVSALAPHWQAAMKRHRPKVPYIHVMKGDAVVYEDTLPADVEATKALIGKYVTAAKASEKGR